MSDWQHNSVLGPLGTPPTVMFTAHFTISHITEFSSILKNYVMEECYVTKLDKINLIYSNFRTLALNCSLWDKFVDVLQFSTVTSGFSGLE